MTVEAKPCRPVGRGFQGLTGLRFSSVETTRVEQLPSEEPGPAELFEEHERAAVVRLAVSRLDNLDAGALLALTGDEPRDALADAFGLQRSRLPERERKVLRRLERALDPWWGGDARR
jgi:hypothetical protein